MNFNQLRYVKAVAEKGSFTSAAEQCYVTQPTLSNAIAQLEHEFGARLFTRTTRTVSLTSFGAHILPFIEKILGAQAELLHESRNFAEYSRKTVRIGISPLLRADWLAPMLENFKETHAGVEILLHEQNMEDLYRMLDENLLDFVFGIAGVHKPSWRAVSLYEEPLCFIPRGADWPKGGETVSLQDISKETFVMVPDVCGLAQATRALFRKHRRKLNEYPGEALGYQVLEEWAALGLGAAVLPKSKIQFPQRGIYALMDKKDREITLNFEAVWPNAENGPEHLQQFIMFLTTYRKN